MRKLILLVVVLGVLPLAAWAAGDASQAIQKHDADFAAAWNRHDPQAMADFWAPDGDVVNPFGRWAKGRAEIVKLFEDEQSGPMKESTFTAEGVPETRDLAPGLVLADWDYSISGMVAPGGMKLPSQKGHIAAIWKQAGDDWSLIAIRASLEPMKGPGARRMKMK